MTTSTICHDTISVFGDVICLYFYYYHFLNCNLEAATNTDNQCIGPDYHPSEQPICRQPAQICLAE